jgi:hypothetical protein
LSIAQLQLLAADLGFNMLQPHEPLTVDYITFVASEKVLLCTRCSIAVLVKGLDTYLQKAYYVRPQLQRTIILRFNSVPAAQYFYKLVLCLDQLILLTYLLLLAPRFCCLHYLEGKTIN